MKMIIREIVARELTAAMSGPEAASAAVRAVCRPEDPAESRTPAAPGASRATEDSV